MHGFDNAEDTSISSGRHQPVAGALLAMQAWAGILDASFGYVSSEEQPMNLQNFRLIAAPFTPMRPDGSLNLPVVREQAHYLATHGVKGVFIGGTTGEGQSLTIEERMALADAWAQCHRSENLKLIVHVGHNSQADAIRLASHAAARNADAVAMHGPMWFRGVSLADLIAFCAPVAAAAASLPFYLYDMPSITGITVSSAEFLAQAKEVIPNLVGIKYTNPDCVTLQECVQAKGRAYDILWGSDEALLAGIALGAAGAVGSTYNFAAPLYLRLIKAVEAGDWETARAEQAKSVAMVRVFQQFTALAAIKYTMSLVGVDCGPVRLPVRGLSAADEKKLRADLERLNFAGELAS